jgi:pimeloyl-ACP methyl ester carboxylesterase
MPEVPPLRGAIDEPAGRRRRPGPCRDSVGRVIRLVCWMALASVACRAEARDADGATRATPDASDESRRVAATAKPAAAEMDRVDGAKDDAAAGAGRDAAASSLPALSGFFEALPVANHPDAWMSLPTGATGKRPVVVVVHGAGDRPDWQCGGWRRATGEYPFVVCPRGAYAPGDSTKSDVRYTHRGGATLLAYIDASLAALQERYPDYVDTSSPVLAGFSLGASEILALAVQDPGRFPRIALVEGATDPWTDARIDAYVAGGGLRVLFGAGQRANEAAAKASAKRLIARGLGARVVYAPVNHTFEPPLEDAIGGELAWWLAGDARWNL